MVRERCGVLFGQILQSSWLVHSVGSQGCDTEESVAMVTGQRGYQGRLQG